MFKHCLPQGALDEGRDFGSLVIFALLQSQRRSFDSLCPRQLLPVISFTKGLLPRTPVNQQKLYIHRKCKPFSGSRGARRGSASNCCSRRQLRRSAAHPAPACAHRCRGLPAPACISALPQHPGHSPVPHFQGVRAARSSEKRSGHQSRERSLSGCARAERGDKAGL